MEMGHKEGFKEIQFRTVAQAAAIHVFYIIASKSFNLIDSKTELYSFTSSEDIYFYKVQSAAKYLLY